MDQLKEIILHKLRIMVEYREKINKTQNSSAYAEELLKEKKKQSSRQVIQSRLLQNLVNRKIQAPYRIEYNYHLIVRQFYTNSQYMMKIFDPKFEYIDKQKHDIYANIVAMYVQFFQQQNCSRRAQQVMHIYKKRLCEKVWFYEYLQSFLIPTIFNWFVEWVRKTFNTFIKNTLIELNQPAKKDRVNDKNLRKVKLEKQMQMHRASIQRIKSSLRGNKEAPIIFIKKSVIIDLNEKSRDDQNKQSNILCRPKNIKSSREYQKAMPKQQLQQKQNNNKEIDVKIAKFSTHNSSSIPNLSSLNNINSLGIKQQSSFNGINKEVLYASYAQQFGNYYKLNAALIPDLDLGYLKCHRRADKREQIKSKFGEVVRSLVRGQVEIKKSIDQYCLQYFAKFSKKKLEKEKQAKQKQKIQNQTKQKLQKNAHQSLSGEKSKRRFRKQVAKMFDNEQQKQTSNFLLQDTKQDIKHRKSKSMNSRAQCQKKHTILQLPQIKGAASGISVSRSPSKLKRILLMSPNRYTNQGEGTIFGRERISVSLAEQKKQQTQQPKLTARQRLSTDLIRDFKYEIKHKQINLLPMNAYEHILKVARSKTLLRRSAKRKEKGAMSGQKSKILRIHDVDPEHHENSADIDKFWLHSKKFSNSESIDEQLNDGVFYLPKIKT